MPGGKKGAKERESAPPTTTPPTKSPDPPKPAQNNSRGGSGWRGGLALVLLVIGCGLTFYMLWTRSSGPPPMQENFQRGLQFVQQGDWENALVEFAVACVREEDNSAHHCHAATAAMRLGKRKKAVKYGKQCVVLEGPSGPRVREALSVLAKAGLTNQDFRSLRLRAGITRTFAQLALDYAKAQDYQTALVFFTIAKEDSAPDARLEHNLALVQQKLGRLDLAAQHYREALRLSPDSPQAASQRTSLDAILAQLETQGEVDPETLIDQDPEFQDLQNENRVNRQADLAEGDEDEEQGDEESTTQKKSKRNEEEEARLQQQRQEQQRQEQQRQEQQRQEQQRKEQQRKEQQRQQEQQELQQEQQRKEQLQQEQQEQQKQQKSDKPSKKAEEDEWVKIGKALQEAKLKVQAYAVKSPPSTSSESSSTSRSSGKKESSSSDRESQREKQSVTPPKDQFSDMEATLKGRSPVDVAIKLAEAGRLEEALPYFIYAEQLAPTVWSSHNNLARTYLLLGRNAQALAHYKRALELDPNNEQAETQRTNVGHLSRMLGKKS